MIPLSMECSWGSIPPSIAMREVIIKIPCQLSLVEGKTCNTIVNPGMIVRNHRSIDGIEGSEIFMDSNVDAIDVYEILKTKYPFDDLKMVRIRGECLTEESFDFVSDLSRDIELEMGKHQIILETSMKPGESRDRLGRLMERGMIDHVCLYVKIHPEVIPGEVDGIVNGLIDCIMAKRSDNLRSVTLCMVIDDKSSISSAIDMISTVRDACMDDDYYKDMGGLAMFTFGFSILPTSDSPDVNNVISMIASQISKNDFDDSKIRVISPSSSRVTGWIDA